MQAIIFVGVQGSGKSTYYREHFFHTHVRVSLDLLRTRHREQIFLHSCLATQQRFVIDNTNTQRSEREVYIAAARAAKFQVVGYYFDVNLETAIDRNNQRTGGQLIPVKGVVGTFRRLEKPALDEGFDLLYTLRPSEVHGWTIVAVETAAPAKVDTGQQSSPP
ncbi:MAG TPA: ATP-binding protein [Bryobacteraceae bacterium]|jgi:predicted kinase|nr:ATP-binding protein [Bryobacteraceae bacterium]